MNYIQATIIELTKDNPDFMQCIKNLGHRKVDNLWHILHPQDRSYDGFTCKEWENRVNDDFYPPSMTPQNR